MSHKQDVQPVAASQSRRPSNTSNGTAAIALPLFETVKLFGFVAQMIENGSKLRQIWQHFRYSVRWELFF
jgi:hypothetical protein